jgi:hypothetical protein
MFSWEIKQLLELRSYLLDVKEYFEICNTSPQIREVSYNQFENNFYIRTEDKYEFKFKVKKER